MSKEARSEQTCPVCSRHQLAVDRPPEIDIMGVQAYSDMLGMGDLQNEGAVGIVCLNCKTRWRDKAAFDRGEPQPDIAADAPSDMDFGDDDGGGDGGE
jgi:hypothetical protein